MTYGVSVVRDFNNFPIKIAKPKFAIKASTPIANHSMNDIGFPL